MKRSSGSRKTATNLSESVHQQLNMYALAAGAAGVSLLALAQPSEAKIVYTSANTRISGLVRLDLNNDGIPDFGLCISSQSNSCNQPRLPRGAMHQFLVALPAHAESQQNQLYATSKGWAAALRPGFHIGSKRKFSPAGYRGMAFLTFLSTRTSITGPWANAVDRYLALKFIIKGKLHYGWARLTVLGQGGIVATLTGYAYETIPGKSIIAGKTHGRADDFTNENSGPGASVTIPIPDTPQPASLGMLALGAQGVPLRRKRWVLEGSRN